MNECNNTILPEVPCAASDRDGTGSKPGEGHQQDGQIHPDEDASNDVANNAAPAPNGPIDYPTPPALLNTEVLVWDEDDFPANNFVALGRRLAAAGDIYRRPNYAGGLLLASDQPNIDPVVIDTGCRLGAIIADRLRVRVLKAGNTRGNRIPSAHLKTMLSSEAFLQRFRPVDEVVYVPSYVPTFDLLRPGYNDGGVGQRLLYVGPAPEVADGTGTIDAFLDIMAFASNADRTNAVALSLTVLLHNLWPGAKPFGIVTSSKSHGGKDTIVSFAAGNTGKVSVDYERKDWAFRQGFVAALKACPKAGVVHIENARLDRGDRFIASAFLERFLTDPEPLLHSSKARDTLKIENRFVITASTNEGTLSEDLMNRGLPIRLNPTGNVNERETPIGNPKHEYLPANRGRIEAELRGMIERWKVAGRPLDETVRHPFSEWAKTVGGILMVNGYKDFLGNYSLRKTADDPLRRGLGLLGADRPGEWLRADAWARLAGNIGVAKVVIPEHDRDTDQGRERGIGVVLSAHRDETFDVETDEERLTLRLEKLRRRFDGAEPTTRYRFVVLDKTMIPEDPSNDQ